MDSNTPSTETQTPDMAALKEERAAKKRKRRTVRLTLQIFPLAFGMIGLYLISCWSQVVRLDVPESDATPYYFGMAMVLLGLQIPMLLEINRRRTKGFVNRHLLMLLAILTSVLLTVAYSVAPKVDFNEVLDQELPLHDVDDHDGDDETDEMND